MGTSYQEKGLVSKEKVLFAVSILLITTVRPGKLGCRLNKDALPSIFQIFQNICIKSKKLNQKGILLYIQKVHWTKNMHVTLSIQSCMVNWYRTCLCFKRDTWCRNSQNKSVLCNKKFNEEINEKESRTWLTCWRPWNRKSWSLNEQHVICLKTLAALLLDYLKTHSRTQRQTQGRAITIIMKSTNLLWLNTISKQRHMNLSEMFSDCHIPQEHGLMLIASLGISSVLLNLLDRLLK